MALADYLNTDFVVLDKTTVPDPMGGILIKYQEGAPFRAALVPDRTTEMRIAQQNGARALYTLVVDRKIALERGTHIRRVQDQADFNLLSDTADMQAPVRSALRFSQASVERVKL